MTGQMCIECTEMTTLLESEQVNKSTSQQVTSVVKVHDSLSKSQRCKISFRKHDIAFECGVPVCILGRIAKMPESVAQAAAPR